MDEAGFIDATANPPATRPSRVAVRHAVTDLGALRPTPAEPHLRLQLHWRGRKLGKADIDLPPGLTWESTVERWVREETLPRLLPRSVRMAWRYPKLLGWLLRPFATRRGLRYLWHLAHTPPTNWLVGVRALIGSGLQRGLNGQPAHATNSLGSSAQSWDRSRWESLFASPDPWGYASDYEQTKYEHTLELLPGGTIERGLELACAEGHFTVQLAPRVRSLLAADIAAPALERAAQRCAGHVHVEFRRLDMRSDPLPSGFDLIVCSEVLYYIGDGADLRRFARRLAAAVVPGGHLLLTHANAVVDNPYATGFNWPVGFAAEHIGATFARRPDLEFVRELRTPVYRVQLFRRRAGSGQASSAPRELLERSNGDLGGLAATINWGGCATTRAEASHAYVTRALPILMYHQIASDGPAELAPYRITPAAFERQLAYLRRHGYRSITLAQWCQALTWHDGIIDDRSVLLTFDDGYRDFLTDAWPLLRAYGFGATLFVSTDHVGGQADWDSQFGEPAALLDWDELRMLAAAGVEVGAHGRTHSYLTRLPARRMVAEGLESKRKLEAELGNPISIMAYPFGDENLPVRRAMAGCGYLAALPTRPGLARLGDNPMSMPRQLVTEEENLDRFVAQLGSPTKATLDRRLRYRWLRHARKNLI